MTDTETIETVAGDYTLTFHADDCVEKPYDNGFVLIVDGWDHYASYDRIDIEEDAENLSPGWVMGTLRASRYGYRNEADTDARSGAAIVRYLSLLGHHGVTVIDADYDPIDASSDRSERVHGIAWAPPDATDPEKYVTVCLAQWRAWATGEAFFYTLTSPSHDEIECVGGYYDIPGEREYVLSEATATAQRDAADRIAAANLAGAGFIGLI